MAEPPPLTDEDRGCIQAANQDLIDELFGRQMRELGREGQHRDGVDPGRLEELELALGPRQQARGSFGTKRYQRVAISRNDHRVAATGLGFGDRARDQGAMAEVHAIERADRDRGPRGRRLERFDTDRDPQRGTTRSAAR